MSDNKDLNAFDENETVYDESSSVEEEKVVEQAEETGGNEATENNLDKELEELRDVFQQELDKAAAEAENCDNEEAENNGDTDSVSADNLCLCCGEKERMEGSDYCEDCYEAMRHYPFKWAYFLVAALAVYVAVLAVGKIGAINRGWVYAYEGDTLAHAGWFQEANEKYQYAQNYLYRANVEPKLVYLHNIETSYKIGGFSVINNLPTSVATLYDEWELNLPHMKKLKEYYLKSQEMSATIQTVYDEIIVKYTDYSVEDLPYDDIIKELDGIAALGLHIGLDDDGNEIEDEPTTEFNGTMSTSDAVYFKRTTRYDKAMIEYFKFYFATTCTRSSEEKISFLENVRAASPDMIWLYASELGSEYARSGNKEKALELADIISEQSETSISSYYVRSLVAKIIDNDFEKAIDYCNQGNGYTEYYEFYRQIALNYLAMGDYEKAFENAKKAYELEQNDFANINTLAFSALAVGDKDEYARMEKLLDDFNSEVELENGKMEFSKGVLDLKNNKRSVDEILKQGGYDLND